MKNRIQTQPLSFSLLLGILLALLAVSVVLADGGIDPTNKYAWSANAGWINFADANGGVTVYSDHLEGYAWAENVGWIRLGSYDGGGSHSYANDAANTYGVNNDGCGNLAGYAWGTNIGWINFNPTDSQVTINPATGDFDGYAWGENIGYIHFQNASPAYKVNTSWRGPPVVTPTIDVDGVNIELDWSAVQGATSYNIYSALDEPYFMPGSPYDDTTTMPWPDDGAAGDPAENHYYIVRSVGCTGPIESDNSQRLGEFDFALAPGS